MYGRCTMDVNGVTYTDTLLIQSGNVLRDVVQRRSPMPGCVSCGIGRSLTADSVVEVCAAVDYVGPAVGHVPDGLLQGDGAPGELLRQRLGGVHQLPRQGPVGTGSRGHIGNDQEEGRGAQS